jgi:5-methylcytosine-specific restriction endonuclease McrA
VRELPPGDQPSDWLDNGSQGAASAELVPEPARARATTEQPPGEEAREDEQRDQSVPAGALLLAPQRYSVQFTASQEYLDLLEQAKDLLAPVVARRDLEQVHLRALRLLVADLKKRKYAVTERSRSASGSARSKERSAPARIEANEQASEVSQHRRSRKRAAEQAKAGPRATPAAGELGTRTIPAAVRRAVAKRDQYRCTYVDDRGHRCRETSGLELHHEHAYARGGPPTTANIALRCRAHNALAAEQDYGREFMASKLGRAPAPARSS